MMYSNNNMCPVYPEESDLIRENMKLSEALNHACDEIKSLQKENKELKETLKQLDYNQVEKRIIDMKVEFDLSDPEYRHIKLTDPKTVEKILYRDLLDWFNEDEGFEKLTVKCTDITDKLEKVDEEDKN